MKEIRADLFVGDQNDAESVLANPSGWAIVHACKEPYHREALGYPGRGAPNDHPEYLVARRGDRLMLNIVDVDDSRFISDTMIDAALEFIRDRLAEGKKVLVHCNQGKSRSPVIALLYLRQSDPVVSSLQFDQAEKWMWRRYPDYAPSKGIRDFARKRWDST